MLLYCKFLKKAVLIFLNFILKKINVEQIGVSTSTTLRTQKSGLLS